MNNMACGVLTVAGTPYIYCVGGSQVTVTDTTDRVFRYDPVTDVLSPPWLLPGPAACRNDSARWLHGASTTSSISWAD